MNIKKALYIAIIAGFALTALSTYAAQDSNDTRYLVKSNSSIWAKSFGARHQFENGFTADLSDFQIKVAKIFGLEVQAVPKLSILDPVPQGNISAPPQKGGPQPKGPSSQVPWGVKMLYGNTLTGTAKPSGGAGVIVAVLDTGVDKTHPDLKNRVTGCKDFSTSLPVVDGSCTDKNGHGTHVSGIIAADGGSGKGIYGVAPEAHIFSYKVCGNNGSCYADDIAAGINAAADNGAQIINMSLGADTEIPFVTDAVNYAVSKGVIVVAAAGNDGPYQDSIDYPGALAPVVSVAAIDSTQAIPDWSSRGKNTLTAAFVKEAHDVEFAAPGVSVESTWPGGGYSVLSGTSMATPHIAGFLAKEWQSDAIVPSDATRNLLHTFSHDLGSVGDDDASGWGIPTL